MTTVVAEITGIDELNRKLASIASHLPKQVAEDAVTEGAAVVQFYAQHNALSVFSKRQRGTLRNSIYPAVQRTPTGAAAEIGPHVIYGRIQELGGDIPRISPKGKAYTIRISPHPYLAPAVEDHRDQIIDVMRKAVEDGILQSV